MKPIFLGDGLDAEGIHDPVYWQDRIKYWQQAVNEHRGRSSEHYKKIVLGFEMLLDGRAQYKEDGKIYY